MKKDILKDFVARNRDDFDDQEPDLDVLTKIQSRLGFNPQPVISPRSKVIKLRYWWAVAALFVVVIGITMLFRQNTETTRSVAHTQQQPVIPAIDAHKEDSIAPAVAGLGDRGLKRAVVRKLKQRQQDKSIHANTATKETVASGVTINDLNSVLQNESSSVRLEAILALGKRNTLLSYKELQTLSYAMNNDPNSNVRLAVLELLQKQESRMEVEHLLLESVAQQDDPVVQIELLASLSPDEAVKVKQQLLDITRDPASIDAVRSQAYAVLLRSDTSF